ncbi:unnamed protein product [Arabis nemorensis]|uniref:Uncharacterized protein n=1 Tax=Arabis nemorensis TaxID=586526 RepID=A0A565BBU5_9BRAS|nr:unnamed protein product [Arabis nemorensis]
MSVSSEDVPQLVEKPTPTKRKRPSPTRKGSKAKKAKSSAPIKVEWIKGLSHIFFVLLHRAVESQIQESRRPEPPRPRSRDM